MQIASRLLKRALQLGHADLDYISFDHAIRGADMMRISERAQRTMEFLVIGLVMGVTEDLLAVWLSTGEPITWSVLGIVIVVALPFAFLSEYIVDHPKFWQRTIGLRLKKPGSDDPSR